MSSNLTRNVKGTINNLSHIRWALVLYDLIVFAVVAVLLLGFYGGIENLSIEGMLIQSLLCVACVEVMRFVGNIYGQVWRYGGIQCYIRLLCTDAVAFWI